MSIFKDIDSDLANSRSFTRAAELKAAHYLPRGKEVLFLFGNMVNLAPARVLHVTEFDGFISVQVRNLKTGGVRNIPLDAIQQVRP